MFAAMLGLGGWEIILILFLLPLALAFMAFWIWIYERIITWCPAGTWISWIT